jgi:deoxyribose-phosphate aldolase
MAAPTPIDRAELDFDNGSFDSYGFAAKALSSQAELAAVIDHTLQKPETTRIAIVTLCDEAAEHRFACVMVNPIWAATAVARLAGTGIPVGVAINFPHGASLVSTLRHETAALARLGAREMDMVMPIGQLKSGNYQAVRHTIHAVATVARHHGAVLKVVLETALLNMEEKLRAAEIAIDAGADFIKTSSGFAASGATVADVALMRGVAGGRCGVKASDGIGTLADVKAMLEAGANRIGSSASLAILREMEKTGIRD